MFDVPEEDLTSSLSLAEESNVTATTALPLTTTSFPPTSPTAPPDPDAVTCSGRTFDAFMQLKNSSIYAFRGELRGWIQSVCLFHSSDWLTTQHRLHLCSRGLFLWARWQICHAWVSQTHQGCVGHFWSHWCCFHTHQLPGKNIYIQGLCMWGYILRAH